MSLRAWIDAESTALDLGGSVIVGDVCDWATSAESDIAITLRSISLRSTVTLLGGNSLRAKLAQHRRIRAFMLFRRDRSDAGRNNCERSSGADARALVVADVVRPTDVRARRATARA